MANEPVQHSYRVPTPPSRALKPRSDQCQKVNRWLLCAVALHASRFIMSKQIHDGFIKIAMDTVIFCIKTASAHCTCDCEYSGEQVSKPWGAVRCQRIHSQMFQLRTGPGGGPRISSRGPLGRGRPQFRKLLCGHFFTATQM